MNGVPTSSLKQKLFNPFQRRHTFSFWFNFWRSIRVLCWSSLFGWMMSLATSFIQIVVVLHLLVTPRSLWRVCCHSFLRRVRQLTDHFVHQFIDLWVHWLLGCSIPFFLVQLLFWSLTCSLVYFSISLSSLWFLFFCYKLEILMVIMLLTLPTGCSVLGSF